jgi:hypothetical protein
MAEILYYQAFEKELPNQHYTDADIQNIIRKTQDILSDGEDDNFQNIHPIQ